MADSNAIRRGLSHDFFEEPIPRPARCIFDRQPFGQRKGSDIPGRHAKGQSETGGQIPTEPLVAVRSGTEAMVHVREGDDRHLAGFGQLTK
jgi:hypothetical protein